MIPGALQPQSPYLGEAALQCQHRSNNSKTPVNVRLSNIRVMPTNRERHKHTDRQTETNTYTGCGTASACIPFHAVEAHEHAIADEQCNPHEHVASTC